MSSFRELVSISF